VETVIVDGRVLMRNRKVLMVDEGAALDFGQEESLKLIERAGLQRHIHEPGWGKVRLQFDAPVDLPR
jgi:5-methylthioadenosine/S-adenosylhomocysteine deaminase